MCSAQALIKQVNKRRCGEIQTSHANTFTLGDNCNPDMVKKVIALLNGYKTNCTLNGKVDITQTRNQERNCDQDTGKPDVVRITHKGMKCRA